MGLLDRFMGGGGTSYDPQSFSLMDRITNPMTQMGLAMLTGGNPAQAAALAQKSKTQQMMMPYQMKMMQGQMQSLQAAAQQRQARSDYIGGLPEDQQAQARAFPELYAKKQFGDTRTSLQKEFDRAKTGGFKGSIGDFAQSKQRPRVTAGADEIPSVTDLLKFRDKKGNAPTGMLTYAQLAAQDYQLSDKPVEKDKISSYISNSLTTASDAVVDILNSPDFDPASPEHIAGNLSNFLASGDYQKYKASADEWATNMVFLRSGATAREEEKKAAFENFWPQPGDKSEAIFFKTKLRINQEINAHALSGMGGRANKESSEKAIEKLEKQIKDLEAKGVQDIKRKTISETMESLQENIYQFGDDPERDERIKASRSRYGLD